MSVCVLGLLAASLAACGGGSRDAAAASIHRSDSAATRAVATPAVHRDSGATSARPPLSAEEKQFYRDMAKSSLAYLTTNWQASTGLVNATPDWTNTTMWDVGAQLLGFHAAKELGLISASDYDARMRKTLATLERMPLYHNAAFSKLYSTTRGSLSSDGRAGWSATDLGRFLIALKIIAERDPQFAAQAERIAKRIDFNQVVHDGYLQGQLIGTDGKPWSFQEGRIGYEQYIANGFALWGADVHNALDLKKNAQPVTVMGVPLLADTRSQDRLLSEPFILYGLELGMPSDVADLAKNVLAAQEARYKADGQITIATEDAVAVPPDYFYYYCVYCGRKPFVIQNASAGREVSSPRWVSTKAAFGWQAILPDDYTRAATEYVAAARDANRGWASGVMEGSKQSTKTFDINTASVLLEVALYELRGGKPLIQDAPLQP